MKLGGKRLLFAGLFLVLLTPFASALPDGLERVAEDHGFSGEAGGGFAWSPFPDYTSGLPLPAVAQGIIAGIVGVVLMVLLLRGLGRYLTKEQSGDARQI